MNELPGVNAKMVQSAQVANTIHSLRARNKQAVLPTFHKLLHMEWCIFCSVSEEYF